MGLEIYLATLGTVLYAVWLFRSRRVKAAERNFSENLTAASIHTIEAAFIRDGAAGVRELRDASALCDRELAGNTEPAGIERDLIARGFAFDRDLRQTMTGLRCGLFVVAIPAFAAVCLSVWAGAHHASRIVRFEWFVAGAVTVVAILLVTHLGTSTERGRRALAMRRAAFPLELLREADPTEAVALYGGRAKRRDGNGGDTSGDGGTSTYFWSADGGHGSHGDGGGHSSSHSCGGASCCSSGCGGD